MAYKVSEGSMAKLSLSFFNQVKNRLGIHTCSRTRLATGRTAQVKTTSLNTSRLMVLTSLDSLWKELGHNNCTGHIALKYLHFNK